MFSLQRLLSRDDKMFDLMDGCAEEARAAIQGLVVFLRAPQDQRSLDAFAAARRKEKGLAVELTEQLCRTFVTPLEREDIEALSHALYKIPKISEKFAERCLLCSKAVQGLGFDRHAELLEKAGDLIVQMVRQLRGVTELQRIKQQNHELQRIEGEGDKLMLQTLHDVYESNRDPFEVMLLKDLLEMLERVFDRSRDVGNIVFHIILKHA